MLTASHGAFEDMPQSCRAPEKNAAAVALGRLGGVARVKTMTAKQRSDAARHAAKARWAKVRRRKAR